MKKVIVPKAFINMTCCILGEEMRKFKSIDEYFEDFFIGESLDYKKTRGLSP